METKRNANFRKIVLLEFFEKKPIEIYSKIFDFSSFQHDEKNTFYGCSYGLCRFTACQ